MLVCIGGHFTIAPARAAEAVKLVKPKQVWPMHYGTFPALAGTPAELAAAIKKIGARTQLQPKKVGESLLLSTPL